MDHSYCEDFQNRSINSRMFINWKLGHTTALSTVISLVFFLFVSKQTERVSGRDLNSEPAAVEKNWAVYLGSLVHISDTFL